MASQFFRLYYISEVPSILEIGDITLVLVSSTIMLFMSIVVSSTLSKNVELNVSEINKFVVRCINLQKSYAPGLMNWC